MITYRNELDYQFCPGCSHGLVLDALNRALMRLQERDGEGWDPARIVIVTDIGCVGLSDQYFVTSGFHGLHGRSLTYATGIKLARPDLHVIVLIGDGGCGIGGTHLINAARRDINVTVLVFNNLNFGMTGGEHSVTTPLQQKTSTTPGGSSEMPLDIAATVAANGATFVWRGTAYDSDLDRQTEIALDHKGFALLDIWELCVAYYASLNRVSPSVLKDQMSGLGFAAGVIPTKMRASQTDSLHLDALGALPASSESARARLSHPIAAQFEPQVTGPVALLIAGSAGGHIRAAGRMVCTAAMMSNLWVTQRDDYPVTVRAGHSTSEVRISAEPLETAPCQDFDVLFFLDQQGFRKAYIHVVKMLATGRPKDGWIFIAPDLVEAVAELKRSNACCESRVYVIDVRQVKGIPRSSQGMAAVAAGLVRAGILSPPALIEAAAALNPAYAQANRDAVTKVLGGLDEVLAPLV